MTMCITDTGCHLRRKTTSEIRQLPEKMCFMCSITQTTSRHLVCETDP